VETAVTKLSDFDIVSLTQTYAAGCIAESFGYVLCYCGASSTFKIRLYMNAIQVAESAYLTSTKYNHIQLSSYSIALSGSKIVKLSAHNYVNYTETVVVCGTEENSGTPAMAGVFCGSVKAA
jgi:hypothetical protein